MNMIKKRIERAQLNIVSKLGEIATPVISDVMGRVNCMDSRIRPMHNNAKLCGTAVTVKSYVSDNLMLHAGVYYAKEGDVLVVDAGDYRNSGLCGEIMASQAIKNGIKGMIIDGGVRDIQEMEEMGFPVFASGISARGGFKNSEGSVNCQISCGGVSVMPGDAIIADVNGVVVVPKNQVESVYNKCVSKLEAEKEIINRINAGEQLFKFGKMDEIIKNLGIKVSE